MLSQRVVLNNVPLGSHAGADLDVLYPLGTILAIREPLFRLAGVFSLIFASREDFS